MITRRSHPRYLATLRNHGEVSNHHHRAHWNLTRGLRRARLIFLRAGLVRTLLRLLQRRIGIRLGGGIVAKRHLQLRREITQDAFVAQSALTVYSDLSAMPIIPDSFVPFLFGIGLCEATGLGAMVWTASR